MIKNHINFNNKRKRFVAIGAAAVTIMLVASVGIIGAAPLSVQQQGREQAPGQRVTSSNIVDGEVRNQDLANNAVTSDKIANGEVTSEDIEDGTITSADIAEGTIPPPDDGTPPDDSVTSATIVDETITSEDIGEGQVATQDLANGAVTQEKIASGAIQPNVFPFRGATITLQGGAAQGFLVECPPGSVVISGGWDSSQIFVHASDNHWAGQALWQITLVNTNPSLSAQVAPIIMCMGSSPR